MRGLICMNAQGRKITIVQQNGKWVVCVKSDSHSRHQSFETEEEARRYIRQLSLKDDAA